jgi:hypothetical protein
VAAVVMICIGSLGLVEPAAVASGPGPVFYVATFGSDAGNNCLSKVVPCQTIGQALANEGSEGSGGTIKVAGGTYVGQLTLSSANSGVTILGAGPKRTIIEAPSTGLQDLCDPNGPVLPCPAPPTAPTNPLYYVIGLTGASNVTIQGVQVSGANGIASIPTPALCSVGQEYAGVYFDDSSGVLNDVSVGGIDMPVDQASCPGAARGVYVASDTGSTSSVSMTKVSLASALCLAKTTVPLAQNSVLPGYSDQNVPVSRVPRKRACKGWTHGPVTIGGAEVTANAFGAHTIQVSGTVPYAVPAGATLNIANPYLSAYGDSGIVCQDSGTYCDIGQSTVQGSGASDIADQTGIEIDQASATLFGNKVSDNSSTCGPVVTACPAGSAPGQGIELLNAASVSVNGNTVTDNDVNIDGTQTPAGLASDAAGRGPFNDGQTFAGSSTLNSLSANFVPSDVGRAVTEDCGPGQSPVCMWNTYFDGTVSDGSLVLTSASAHFTSADVGKPIVDDDNLPLVIAPGTTITAVTSPTAVMISELPTCASTCNSVAFYLPARQGILDGTFIDQFVSSQEVLLNQPAQQTATRTISLGTLPGTWMITGNTASDATALGGAAGSPAFGEGIELDGTDPSSIGPNPCAPSAGYEPAVIDLQGNTANSNAGTGILLSGASCTHIGGSASGQGNTATGNQIGLALAASATTSSEDNAVTGNAFTGNTFGVLAGGPFAPTQYGGPASPGSSGNSMSDNVWKSNTLANVVDFAEWLCGSCLGSNAMTLAGSLVPGTQISSIMVTGVPAGGLAAGTVLQITDSPLPAVTVWLTAAVPFAAGVVSLPISPFTPTGGYTGATVTSDPFSITSGANSWGTPTADSCDPVENGAVGFDSLTLRAGFDSC